jgi:hypothetical protein
MSARVSGLSDAHAAEARRVIVLGIDHLLRNPNLLDYTQEAEARWEAILNDWRIADGNYIKRGDCSSTHTWLVMNALTHVGAHHDWVNDLAYKGGFTGTIAAHGKLVRDVRNAKVADGVLYGPRPDFEHVATYLGGGVVFSHGSMAGPFKLGVDYRPDRGMIRRSI